MQRSSTTVLKRGWRWKYQKADARQSSLFFSSGQLFCYMVTRIFCWKWTLNGRCWVQSRADPVSHLGAEREQEAWFCSKPRMKWSQGKGACWNHSLQLESSPSPAGPWAPSEEHYSKFLKPHGSHQMLGLKRYQHFLKETPIWVTKKVPQKLPHSTLIPQKNWISATTTAASSWRLQCRVCTSDGTETACAIISRN